MVTYKEFARELVNHGIDKTIVDRLFQEYMTVKRKHLQDDYEKVILHAAKLSELILSLIKNKTTNKKIDIDNLHFETLFQEIRNYPKKSAEEVLFTLVIPRVARSIYTIRNKKNIAHVKKIDPDFVDAYYCISACDWIMSQLVMLFYRSNPEEARELVDSILEKKIPLIEEFENGTITILQHLPLKDKFMLALYHIYPRRISKEDLINMIKYDNPFYAERVLMKLENEILIHRNNKGNKLTQKGIEYVQNNILSIY